MKKILLLFFILQPFIIFSQHNSEKVIPQEKYGSHTEWSPQDKHFSYIFLNYATAIPFSKNIENPGKAGNFNLGYSYRYKIVKAFDIGAELNYSLRFSVIKNDNRNIFDSLITFTPQKITTISNGIGAALFCRFNLKYASHRQLGLFIDLGTFYSYSIGNKMVFTDSNSDKNQSYKYRSTIKNAGFLEDNGFGPFLRLGYNYISFYCKYDFSNWIINYGESNTDYSRSALLLGLQLNLYRK